MLHLHSSNDNSFDHTKKLHSELSTPKSNKNRFLKETPTTALQTTEGKENNPFKKFAENLITIEEEEEIAAKKVAANKNPFMKGPRASEESPSAKKSTVSV